jgi:predicted GH43/DUF377 family glycosyl hydrolase
MNDILSLETTVTRGGIVLEPNGEPSEREGVLNPASARTRDGRLLIYPRMVAEGNRSRVGVCEELTGSAGERTFQRLGFALEPFAPYELRTAPGGYGCEDPRVTFVPVLDRYLMAYTAYGPDGPRIAVALSPDGYEWERLGLLDFGAGGLPTGDDKDGAFFPEPVISPAGVESIAFYHRPMLHMSTVDGRGSIPMILHMPPSDRESTRIGYVPLAPVLRDRKALLAVAESAVVLEPSSWDRIKTGAGTPPILVEEGWLSIYHGVDPVFHDNGRTTLCYSAGVVIHDRERPHLVRYRSPHPVLTPETAEERSGIVNNVVFPTAIDRLPDAHGRSTEIYYGMADSRVGVARFDFGPAVFAETSAESAA